jgi:hypothetical protein
MTPKAIWQESPKMTASASEAEIGAQLTKHFYEFGPSSPHLRLSVPVPIAPTPQLSENTTASPIPAFTISPSHITLLPRMMVPTGQPWTDFPV